MDLVPEIGNRTIVIAYRATDRSLFLAKCCPRRRRVETRFDRSNPIARKESVSRAVSGSSISRDLRSRSSIFRIEYDTLFPDVAVCMQSCSVAVLQCCAPDPLVGMSPDRLWSQRRELPRQANANWLQ